MGAGHPEVYVGGSLRRGSSAWLWRAEYVGVRKAAEGAVGRQQLRLGALLDDVAAVDHDDLVGAPGSREAVGDDDRRAPSSLSVAPRPVVAPAAGQSLSSASQARCRVPPGTCAGPPGRRPAR